MAGCFVGFIGLSSILYLEEIPKSQIRFWNNSRRIFIWNSIYGYRSSLFSKTKEGRWIYGIIIGIVTVIIRGYALFAGGMMFAILIGNTFAPIIDEGSKGI